VSERPQLDTAGVLADVAQRLGASLDLSQTLEEIAQSVVERIGFALAVLNLVVDQGDLEVVAVAGPEAVRNDLLGRRQSAQDWQDALSASEPRGRLRFLDGRKEAIAPSHPHLFTPDVPVLDDPSTWHPMDALFAPLYGGNGVLLGVLSVDVPHDGMRPDAADCELLEVFAIQAALAIDHARLYQDLQRALDEQKRIEGELRHRALHDPLTSLANRELVLDRLEQALARSRRDGRAVAVLFLDVDHFKLVNDSLGHAVGDELLIGLAALLQHHLREVDTAGRLGGDEFVLVLEELSGPAEAIAVAERLLAAVHEPLKLGEETVRASLSIGISMAGLHSTGRDLLTEADTALYRAKAAGRGRWEMFDAAMRSEALAQLALRGELSGAVDRDEFRLHYQPIVELGTGRPLGYEALLRWAHPTRGLLSPAAFLDVLEDSDADSPVAEWVLERACSDAAAWTGDLFVSVNVSPRQLARPELARRVSDVLGRTGLAADRLWIEVTEDRPLDAHQDVADVQRLRALGVQVALDDFGTGYAGLTYLQRLPADTVKIDMVFVQQVEDDAVSRGIVSAVVGLAEALGLRVVAEGVETEGQAAALRELGIRYAQGYLWGQPIPMPGEGQPVLMHPPTLADDLPSELRRLHAVLAASTTVAQVATASVQAARRSLGADGGIFAVLQADGTGRTVHTEGYSDEVVTQLRVITLDSELPLAVTLREGRAVYMQQAEIAVHVNDMLRAASDRVLALGSVPLAGHGALAVSWSGPTEMTRLVREHLEAMADSIAARLDAL
jgi:diguanylate cyclase (GGDEF)-like protein